MTRLIQALLPTRRPAEDKVDARLSKLALDMKRPTKRHVIV